MTNHLENINLEALEKLYKSQIPVSYSKMCDMIGLKKVTGTSKAAQLKQLQTLCDLHVENKKFVIDEYYGSQDILKMFNGRSKYLPYIELLLCSYLSTASNKTAYLTTSDILIICEMVNKNFTRIRTNAHRIQLCNNYHTDFELLDLECFVCNTYGKILHQIVRSALASMERRKIIKIDKAYKYYITENKFNYKLIAPSGSKEFKRFEEIEKDVKEMMGYTDKTFPFIFLEPLNAEEYYRRCNAMAKSEGIHSFIKCKQITTSKYIMHKELESAASQLNELIGEKIFNSKYLNELTAEFKKTMIEETILLNTKVDYDNYVNYNYF